MRLLTLAATFPLGTFLALRSDLPGPTLGLFLLASVLVLALLVGRRHFMWVALLPVVPVLAMLRVEIFHSDQSLALVPHHSPRPVKVQGVVSSDPEAAGVATRFRFRVDMLMPGDEWVNALGDTLVTLRESTDLVRHRDRPYFRYGDRLLLEGTLEAPPELEEFDYPAYLARQGIGTVMSFPEATLLDEGRGAAFYRWLYGVRRRIADSLAQVVPEPQASLGQALLLGLRDNLPEDLVDDFQATGTSHVLAISGLHVGVLLGIAMAVSRRVFGLRRQLYLIMPLGLMWMYALISGMSPSVTRAAIMGTVYLAALFLGRPRSILPALSFAAAVMVALNPNVLMSVSFQLSFTAMAGIALLSEPLSQWLQSLYRVPSVSQSPLSSALDLISYTIAMTVAATVATLPLIAFYFERVSLVGLPTTVLVLPALPIVLITQTISGGLGLLSEVVAQPLGWLAWLATAYISSVVGLVARLPAAALETGRVPTFLVWAYYGVLALLYAVAAFRRPFRRWRTDLSDFSSLSPVFSRGIPLWVLAPVISLAVLLWIAALSQPDRRLHVAFVDVGQGDAVFISTPGGKQVLVDGGPEPTDVVHFLGQKMPFWDRTIDLVVLTHAHSDHVNGLIEVLRRYDVQNILEREVQYDSPPYQAWRQAVAEEGAEVIQARSGQVIALEGGAFVQVVSPGERLLGGTSSDVDNASVVLKLVYGNVSFLLTGDMFGETERVLVAQNAPIDSDVLKVGHHGSRSSSSAAFLDMVSPAAAAISAGEDNRFGHPHLETLEALRGHVSEDLLLLTKDSGTVEFVTDGKRLEVKTER